MCTPYNGLLTKAKVIWQLPINFLIREIDKKSNYEFLEIQVLILLTELCRHFSDLNSQRPEKCDTTHLYLIMPRITAIP